MDTATREAAVAELIGDSLAMTGTLRLRVTGTSMLPSIRPGATVTIRRVSSWQLKRGNVVLLRTDAGVRLHRLVRVDGTTLQTKGDNHAHCDPPCDISQLLGVLDE